MNPLENRKSRQNLGLIALIALLIALPGRPAGVDARRATAEPEWALHPPDCKRDKVAWERFDPYGRWMDSFDKNWRNDLKQVELYKKNKDAWHAAWLKEDVVDTTWIDIDGDGWCDVITSAHRESYTTFSGKPILLKEPRGIYLRTKDGFKSMLPGSNTGEFEGSSITVYWDLKERSAVLIKRVFQGNLISAGDDQENQFHLRHMLRGAFTSLAAGKQDVYQDYYVEVEPLLYNGVLPDEVARRIWEEEARRAGVQDLFTWSK